MSDQKIIIQPITPTEALPLISALDAYQAPLYPPASNHLEPPESLVSPQFTLLGGYQDHNLVAIGAVKWQNDYGEIKRVFVLPEKRGQGLAQAIMAHLEAEIKQRNLAYARLETGIHQTAALRFYESLGYQYIPAFGDYLPDPLSFFMEKKLN